MTLTCGPYAMVSTVFKWQITDFSTAMPRDGYISSVESKLFALKDINAAFAFELHSKRRVGNEPSHTLNLILHDVDDLDSLNLQFKLWIENNHGKKIPKKPRVMTHDFIRGDIHFGLNNFVNSDQLYSPDNGFIINDSILLCCEVLPIMEERKKLPLYASTFHEKLYSLHELGITGDCILQVGNKEFKVAKNILMASSEVFERMFTAETEEKQSNVIKIKDVRSESTDKFIKYLHLRSFTADMEDFAEDLFVLADRYAVDILKDDCVRTLSKAFTDDNIVHFLQLAFTHNSDELKNRSLFYAKDSVDYILDSDQWEQLFENNKALAKEITAAMLKK